MNLTTSSPAKTKNLVSTLAVAIVGCFFLTGCETTSSANYESVKMPPAMHYHAGSSNSYASNKSFNGSSTAPANSISQSAQSTRYSPSQTKQILSRERIITELRDSGVLVFPAVNDHKYIVPEHSWVRGDYSQYFDWYIYYLGARYNAEGMDCDNFADFYRQNLVLSNLKAGGARRGDVPCATLIVNQKDKGIYHALNLVRTDRGWYVVEPQDGTFVALNSYRYRRDITKITF